MSNIVDCDIVISEFELQSRFAFLTGAVEYTYCISAGG